MKRSKMLCYLTKIIRTSGATIGSSHIDYEALAEDVLSAVEEQGMLPPFFHPFDTSLGESQVYVENYKWEIEPEEPMKVEFTAEIKETNGWLVMFNLVVSLLVIKKLADSGKRFKVTCEEIEG